MRDKQIAAPTSKRFRFFQLPRWIRLMIYLPVIAAVLFFTLRQLEFMVTYHPTRYAPGPD